VQLASSCSTQHFCDMQQAIPPEPEPTRSRDEVIDDIVLELGGARGESLIPPKADTRTIYRCIQQAVVQVPQADWEEAGNTVRVEAITSAGREPREPSGGNPISPENIVRAEMVLLFAGLTALYKRQERLREQRRTETEYAQRLDEQFAKLESMHEHSPAPWVSAGFMSGIKGFREALELQIKSRPKGGQKTDHVKAACARAAFHLMKKYSRKKISGSAESSFPLITMWLVEAATGEREASVRRACAAVLRSPPITRVSGTAAMDGAASVTVAGTTRHRD
jgi:hypothetical protein